MLIKCDKCNAEREIEDKTLEWLGGKVRCWHCYQNFYVLLDLPWPLCEPCDLMKG